MKEKAYNRELKQKNFFMWALAIWLILILSIYCYIPCYANEIKDRPEIQTNPGTLYARSAVLMDGSSGRVLYEKNGEEFLANASTTKILTCILALENAELSEIVTVSSYAASMPDVQLHIREGEQYCLEDLLYSLMLESHNDVAVAIAEHISGSQEEFSKLMNQKAKEIGCKNTTFLTPNGLDATQKIKSRNHTTQNYAMQNTEQEIEKSAREQEISHGTTAADLALMMRYCIKISPKKEEFIRITQTPAYSFQNIDKSRSFHCRNHNTFFNMMEGVISGKTGFTGKAGYCYVGALEQEGECYIVALLACGWPGNKNYKWSDCKKLMNYGLEEYEVFELEKLEESYQEKLITEVRNAKRPILHHEEAIVLKRQESEVRKVLLKNGEKIRTKVTKMELEAPLNPGEQVGKIEYYIGEQKWMEEKLYCDKKIEKIDFRWCMLKMEILFL